METVSTGDAVQIAISFRELVGVQFQYWLTITFAAIVAAHIGRNSLPFKLRLGVAALYLLSSALFIGLYLSAAFDYMDYRLLVIDRGAVMNDSIVVLGGLFFLRVSIWIVGALLTMWFLFRHPSRDVN